MSSVVYRILTSAFYLRVQVPTGDTTMLQVEETTTIAEVQKLVEEKKMQVYKDCNLFAVLTDGKKIPVWEDVTLANYKTIEKMVMESKTATVPIGTHSPAPSGNATPLVGTPISNRRGKDPLGILTKGTKEHSDAMNSPSVKTRFKGLAKSINVFSKKEDTGSQTSLHKLDSPSVDKKTSPLGGSMMGTAQKAMMLQSRRPRSASTNLLLSTQSDSSLSLHGTGSSIGSGTESPTSPGHAAHSAQSRHFPSSYRMSTLSKTASIHIDDETADSKSFIERELENVMSQELLVMEDRDTPTDNEQKDLSGDPERIAAFEEKFLKKSDWRSPVKYPPETAQAQTQKVHSFVLLKLHQPEEQPVIVKVQGDMIMEAYCQKLCVRKGLDYETHSFEYGPELKPVEMDVKAGILFTPVTATDVHLVKKAKVYSSISTVEETEETIISNVVDGKYVIMASKKERIFDLLTSTDFEDEKFTNVIFLTYRSFSTPTEFLEYLIVSFYSTLPENASEGDTELYQRTKIPTQLKILKVLHKWIEHHWHDFGLDSQLRTTLQIFLNKTTSQEGEFTEVCRGLLFVADIQRRWFEDLLGTYNTEERKGKRIDSMFEELEVDDIAQQLCIHNSEIFRNIHSIEFLQEIWKKKDDDSSPSFKFFVERFDKESYWVATEMIHCRDPKKRVLALKKFIFLAKKCIELNNFFSSFSLIAGLNLIPVQRLKKTWEALPDKAKQTWSEVEKIADPSKNMRNYRERLQAVSPPMVPFLPIYLKDLTFINDGNQSKVKGLVNVEKLRMMANSVQEITQLGAIAYDFEKKPAILNYLEKPYIERNLNKLKEQATLLEQQ